MPLPRLLNFSPASISQHTSDRRTMVPQALQFAEGWDSDENNDVGNHDKATIEQTLRAWGDDLSAAIDCGFIKVTKGCHQANDPHITMNGVACTNKNTKRCKENMYCGSRSGHIPCK